MNMQMSELMMSSPHLFPRIIRITNSYNLYIDIFIFSLKHVKACLRIKMYRSKHYFKFIQGRFIYFVIAEILDFRHFCEQN